MSPRIVFAAYRPKPAKNAELLLLVKEHLPTLRRLGLVTDRASTLAQSSDGTLVEVFEWKSEQHAGKAHEHPDVAKIWEAMALVCTFESLDQLPEAKKAFAHYSPVTP